MSSEPAGKSAHTARQNMSDGRVCRPSVPSTATQRFAYRMQPHGPYRNPDVRQAEAVAVKAKHDDVKRGKDDRDSTDGLRFKDL